MFLYDAILEHINTEGTATSVHQFGVDGWKVSKNCKELFQVISRSDFKLKGLGVWGWGCVGCCGVGVGWLCGVGCVVWGVSGCGMCGMGWGRGLRELTDKTHMFRFNLSWPSVTQIL